MTEHIRFEGNFDEIEEFCGGDAEWRNPVALVATPSGPLSVKPGQWIVRDDDGTFRVSDDGS